MIRESIEQVLNGNRATNSSFLEYFLHGLSLLYTVVVKARLAGYRHGIFRTRMLPCKVISIGNITVGGTGKTPLTLHVTQMIHKLGCKVVVLSRGYRGAAETTGGVVSDGEHLLMEARRSGDEPYMMALHLKNLRVPVMVGRNRFDIGSAAVNTFRPDVIVLDDAFQHVRLARDLDLVLLDGRRPFANGHLLPRGPLREPVAALQRSSALILNHYSTVQQRPVSKLPREVAANRPVFQARFVPYIARIVPSRTSREYPSAPGIDFLTNIAVYGFSGLARNKRFRQTLKETGCNICGFRSFADHHAYTDGELKSLLEAARKTGAEYLITSEKDWVRIHQKLPLAMKLVVLGVRTDFGRDADAFTAFINRHLNCAGSGRL
jgi:tetraacyldisaccharide 4'-kinase